MDTGASSDLLFPSRLCSDNDFLNSKGWQSQNSNSESGCTTWGFEPGISLYPWFTVILTDAGKGVWITQFTNHKMLCKHKAWVHTESDSKPDLFLNQLIGILAIVCSGIFLGLWFQSQIKATGKTKNYSKQQASFKCWKKYGIHVC